MDPRIKDLAFGAALNAIVRSAGMGPTGAGVGTGSIGDQLRRIGTLPPPSSSTTITTPPEEPAVQTGAPVSVGDSSSGYEPMPGGGAGGGGITFSNPQTSFLDRQGVPMTVADLVGRGVDILSFMSNPLGYIAGRVLTGETMGQRVKGALTPVSTATPVTSIAAVANALGISMDQAESIIGGQPATTPAGPVSTVGIDMFGPQGPYGSTESSYSPSDFGGYGGGTAGETGAPGESSYGLDR